MDWKEKRFLVFGAGLSGTAAVELLKRKNCYVVLYDGNSAIKEEELRAKEPALADVPIFLGELPKEVMKSIDIAVLSPGVPTDLPVGEEMRGQGIEIWGEIELAYVLGKGRVLAITGTNGKTTTTTLLGEIMKEAFADVKMVGNIGIPYTGVADETTEDSVIVAEISSFQLETIHSFRPRISAILNITPDHLNRHHTLANYIAVKESITRNQGPEDVCVLNYEDEVLREFGGQISARVIFFSGKRRLSRGIYLEGEEILYADENGITPVCNVKELQIFGEHNYENVMAASAMAISFGVPMEKLHAALIRFQAVPHRIEYVATKRGVRFYNDSKGTNPDAAIRAIKAMQWPTLLIGGGYDKGSEYDDWIRAFDGKVKKLVLLGATREKIAATAAGCGFPREDILFAENLQEAVDTCYANAENGDAVLLSPACASWGMFRNYEERGDQFKEMVHALKE